MTPYALLLKLSGLSQREAAEFHQVRVDSLKRWVNGRDPTPPGAVEELRDLIGKQERSASEALATYREMIAERGRPEAVSLTSAHSDEDAQARGWPTASAMDMVNARVVAALRLEFDLT